MRKDWLEVELGAIASKIQYGFTESSSLKPIGPKFLRITDIQENRVDWDSVPFCQISSSKLPDYLLEKGDLLFARTGATVGKSFLIRTTIPEAVFASYLIRVRTDERIINEVFLSYFFYSPFYWKQITEGQVGIGQPNVNGTKLKKLRTPLPPLPEQRAIVAKLEQLFSELDSGIADLKRAQANVKIYRLSVMSVEPPDVKFTPLEKVLDDLSQGWSPKCINKSSVEEEQWAVIRTTAIQPSRFIEEENKILPESLEPRQQHEIEVGDLLITRAGPRVRVGVCCLVRKTRKRLINCDKVYRMKVNKNVMSPEFLELVLNSANYLKQIEKIKSGSNDSGLNLTQTRFLQLEVPVPPLKEQARIVQEIDSRLSICDKLEETITINLQKAEACGKAF